MFEQKYEKDQIFFSENFPFLFVKLSIYLNRRVFVMCRTEPPRGTRTRRDEDRTMQKQITQF